MREESTPPTKLPSPTEGKKVILILSAGMGGGHDVAATQLSRLLRDSGYDAPVVDLLNLMRFGYGRFIASVYHAQLRFAPWSYKVIYSLWKRHPGLVKAANGTDTRMARRNLLDQVSLTRPIAIVSTYNLASQVLGELVADGSLDVPVYSFVTDFGVHPYWIHDLIDGYLAVHQSSSRLIRELSDAPIAVCGPLVRPEFLHPNFIQAENVDAEFVRPAVNSGLAARCRQEAAIRSVSPTPSTVRAATRASLGLGDTDTVALVVAGAWGTGEVERSVEDLRGIGGCVPVVVCGNNHRLASRLRRRTRDQRQIVDYTNSMPTLMAASDILVENAGGMTCFEAFASGLPVATYRPLPAHGTDNAHAMNTAGVSTFAHDVGELAPAVHRLTNDGAARSAQIAEAHAVISADPIAEILGLIDPTSPLSGEDGKGRQSRCDSTGRRRPSQVSRRFHPRTHGAGGRGWASRS
ncbi:MAG TPA: glycosyltransferase [Microthrixaceae bacterium]|nr:glycosyltransferase [Microthrixaceae bacterium]